MNVTELNIYPVKSSRASPLQEAQVGTKGLDHDRAWMVIGDDNKAITGRDVNKLVLVSVKVKSNGVVLGAPEHPSIVVTHPGPNNPRVSVKIWSDQCDALVADQNVNDWLSDYLEKSCRLVKMPDDFQRVVDQDIGQPGDTVRFPDAYPVLLTNEASLKDLNERASCEITMGRFRPNIVIKGPDAYAEDAWKRIQVGNVLFDIAELCDRCIMTTIDPITAVKNPDQEPLKTLMRYRRLDKNHVYFGVTLIPRTTGIVRVGDDVTILS